MLSVLRKLLTSGYTLSVSGSGGGGDDKPDDPKDKDEKNPKDPFEDFDFTRFRSRRQGNNPPPGGRGGGFDFSQFTGGRGPQLQTNFNFPRPSRRGIIGLIIAAIVIVLVIVIPSLTGFWTDLIWYQEVGQESVLWTGIWARVAVFAGTALMAFVIIMLNVWVARRIGPGGPVIDANPNNPIAALVGGSVRFLNWLFIGAAIIVSLVMAGSASSAWQTILIYLNAAPWTDTEKIFNNSNSFYVFQVPFYSFVQGWLVGLLVVALIAAVIVYGLNFTLSGRTIALTGGIKAHFSIIGAFLLAVIAWGYQIANYNLVYSPRGVTPGASATDVEAQVPANNILTVIVLIAAVILLGNIFLRHSRVGTITLLGAAGTWLVATIVVGGIYPQLYQNFSIKPNEITKESPYIANTITQTRKAFGLDDATLKKVPFEGNAALASTDIQKNPFIVDNIRLWDYDKVKTVYDQRETLRRYYNFEDVDIDRYQLDLSKSGTSELTQVMLSARELKLSSLDANAKTWQSQHLQFTHGYGVQISPVNEVDAQKQPVNLITQSFPLSNTGILKVSQPRIYYGTSFDGAKDDYAIVGTKLAEIDYPFPDANQAGQGGNATYNYNGKGGIHLDSFFVKAAFAMKLGDFNLLISSDINDNSRLIFRRNIEERAQLLAPFLRFDNDPYLAIVDGKLVWILDAYTFTNRFPHAAYADSRNSINYIRNSVKVVQDAYDGTMTFYIVDESDPIAKTYQSIYPTLFKPASAISQSLRDHFRYPEDLLRIQSALYLTYHVDDPSTYYNRTDQWQLPPDPRPDKSGQLLAATYLVTALPGEAKPEFVLIQPFAPQGKRNMVAWMAARMDGANYGKLVIYDFPQQVNVNGPEQFYATLANDQAFSQQRNLLNQGGSRFEPGPILIIPIDKSVLYVLPFYISSNNNPIPQLNTVVIGTSDNRIATGGSLSEALTKVLQIAPNQVATGGQTTTVTPSGSPTPAVTAASGTPVAGTPLPGGATPEPGTVADYIKSGQNHLQKAEAARAKGDLATYQSELALAQQDLDKLGKLLGTNR